MSFGLLIGFYLVTKPDARIAPRTIVTWWAVAAAVYVLVTLGACRRAVASFARKVIASLGLA